MIVDFAKYSSIKIGQSLHVVKLNRVQSLPKNVQIIGGCNNILLTPEPKNIYMLGDRFDFIYQNENFLHVGCACKSSKVFNYAKKHNIANFEFMQKIPGQIGGMIKMNAGVKQCEIFDNLQKILTPSGWLDKNDIEYSYRKTNINEVVYEAIFKLEFGFSKDKQQLFKSMRQNQPNTPSCGSCFKNPKGFFAGELLQKVGLKGYKINDMAFSDKHANFLVNLQNGTYFDAIKLIKLAKKRVHESFGVKLELEITIM